jgi:hypothetical protein
LPARDVDEAVPPGDGEIMVRDEPVTQLEAVRQTLALLVGIR